VTTRDEARAFFDAIAGRYDRVYAPSSLESRVRLERVLRELPARCRVLDLGVGTGRELSMLLDAGHAVTGVDLSPEMLARCARRTRPVPLVLADLWGELPFDAASFDAVIALHGTLAHPPSQDALVPFAREVARVLRTRGAFVMEVPLPSWADSAGEEVRRHGKGRATFTDGATGATIEACLFEASEWREALGAHLDVSSGLEERGELFLTAVKA
jgi:SAM-dependent methyltransferase